MGLVRVVARNAPPSGHPCATIVASDMLGHVVFHAAFLEYTALATMAVIRYRQTLPAH